MAILSGLTIDDFEKLPDALALNHELVGGELVDVSGNTGNHGDNAHGPGVSFFGVEKTQFYDGNLRVQRFDPDLAIEIVSQNDKFEPRMKKARRYREHGAKEVWIF